MVLSVQINDLLMTRTDFAPGYTLKEEMFAEETVAVFAVLAPTAKVYSRKKFQFE